MNQKWTDEDYVELLDWLEEKDAFLAAYSNRAKAHALGITYSNLNRIITHIRANAADIRSRAEAQKRADNNAMAVFNSWARNNPGHKGNN